MAAGRPGQTEAQTKTIYQYKTELGLTDKQESDLKKILVDFQVYFTDKKKVLAALQKELGGMISKKEDMNKIRKQMEKMARAQVDASCYDIETARKVETILTPEQMAKWRTIQADFQNKVQDQMKEAQARQKAAEAKQ
jgi:Spy/CpxP family protein refolding chaperone